MARDGDNLCTTFQCNLCCFWNLQQCDPLPNVLKDNLLLCVIWRALLDALWGRELQTVEATLHAAWSMFTQWQKVGLTLQIHPLGPFLVYDSLGMGVVVSMLLKSLEPGQYSHKYQQFKTLRKLCAGFSNTTWPPAKEQAAFGQWAGTGPSTSSLTLPLNPSGLRGFLRVVSGVWVKRCAKIGLYPCLPCMD